MEEKNREWRRKYSQTSQQLEQDVTRYHKEQSRLETLKNIAERYDGYGNSIRRVMEQKNHVPGIRGVVADIIHVEKIMRSLLRQLLAEVFRISLRITSRLPSR